MSSNQEDVRKRYGKDPVKEDGRLRKSRAGIRAMDGTQWACYLDLAEALLQYPSCTGMSNHALMIAKRKYYSIQLEDHLATDEP